MSIAKWLLARKLGGGSPFPPVIKRKTGNPIELTDGADAPLVKCVSEIQGSQDLHGYDKPWVGGAGKNKVALNLSPYSTAVNTHCSLNNDSETFMSITSDDSGGYACRHLYYTLSAGTYTASLGATTTTGSSTPAITGYKSGTTTIIINTLSANGSRTFTLSEDTVLDLRFFSTHATPEICTTTFSNFMIESGSTPTTFAPYSNICPITAYTEGEIEVRGKNLFDIKTAQSYGSQGSSTITITDNGISVVTTGNYAGVYCEIEGVANGECALSFDYTFNNPGTASFVVLASDNTTVLYNSGDFTTSGTKTATFTKSTGTKIYLRIYTTRAGNYGNATITDATLHDSEYTSTTHTTTYPSAIYRGSEDVVNGEVSYQKFVVTYNGTEGWIQNPTFTNTYYVNFPSGVIKSLDSIFTNQYIARGSGDIGFMVGSYLNITDPINATSMADWKAYLSTHPLEVCYELATPTTSSVTPTNLPIKSLSGYNHIESSTGEMVVDYITDAYQNFVDTTERALPNTRKGGTKAMDIFLSLEKKDDEEEEVKEETKEDTK